jgi:NADH-quinone oxidoreductase subunit L
MVPWLSFSGLSIDFGYRLDGLSLLMLLVVTGVGSVIHIFSLGYMHDDRSFSRYFAGLSLFTFSMLGIVLSPNFIQMFIFWELVGVSSYLLIGFWYDRNSAADASKKAFLTNRLGDYGFLLGIVLLWATFGTLHFEALEAKMKAQPYLLGGWATAAGLLIFCGALGKSAQFPLHVWLPDAMEGPTPVSALIHAATMVAAGVYMLCRVFFVFNVEALEIIAWIGGITALMAALMAVQQHDIKRILAYSTLSQLGYMVMAVGLNGPVAAMFHLTTHAFFKALLFLGAGSIIHALHHEQNIWQMGGLSRRMKVTFVTFLIGTLALCGVPPLSGFYSKDMILVTAYENRTALFVIATLVAVLTTFYMFRLIFVVFYGPSRSATAGHAHESHSVLTVPLVILAVPSVLAGFFGIEAFVAKSLDVEYHGAHGLAQIFYPLSHSPLAAFAGLGAILFGFMAAFAFYHRAEEDPLAARLGVFARLLENRFYFDEFYQRLIRWTHELLASIASFLDRWLIAGLLVKGTHGTTEFTGRALRLVQTGNMSTYAFLLVAGLAVLIYLMLK